MNAHDLIENANLDAMGLLDHEEREAFERAFRAAPPALQAQVRREQLRLSSMDALLPAAELPVGLKARVMAAVREAMQQVAGRRSGAPAGDAAVVAGVIGQLRPSTGVHRLWRTAAIASVAAALAMSFVSLQFRSSIDEMRQVARNSEVSQYLQSEFGRQFGPRFFSPNTRFVQFTQAPAGPATDAVAGRPSKAMLLLDPASGTGHLFCLDLPSGEREFEVVVIDRDGDRERAVLTFKSTNAGMISSTIQGLSLENARSVVIRLAGDTRPLLSSIQL